MNYEIIDFHTHPFYEKDQNFCFYDNTVKDYKEFAEDLKRAGISRCCGGVIKRFNPKSFGEIAALNEDALLLSEKYGDFYIPGIAVHPDYVEESIDEIRKYSAVGVKIVGELVPYLMGWQDYYSEAMDAIYEEADKNNMIISFHSNRSGKLEPTVEEAIKKFPNLTFVAAHPREKDLFNVHLERMKKYDNYFLDLSGTGIARYGIIKYGVDKVGSERFLFGTDFPICNPKMYIEGILYEKLKDSDYENIFSKNAKRILKLQ